MNGQTSTASVVRLEAESCAEAAYLDLLLSLVTSQTEWLDLGCGRSLVRDWLPHAHETQIRFHGICKRIAGIDLHEADVHQNPYIHEYHVGSIDQLPFPDASFNLITAQMVVEHVSAPLNVLKESARVLVPNGHFVFITPNLRNPLVTVARMIPDAVKRRFTAYVQRRAPRDIFPTHYRLNTDDAISNALQLVGMTPEIVAFIDGSPDLDHLPVLEKIERWLRALQPSSCRSDLLVHARKSPAA